jgi:UDP-2-acetamido-3-amino-2,3-dideoxy-glucuronate N-acetyltransferase
VLTRIAGSFPGALGFLMRRKVYRRLFASCGKNVIFGRHLVIRGAGRISLGDGVILNDRCLLDAGRGAKSSIVVGDGVFLGAGATLRAAGGALEVQEGANIGSLCTLSARQGVRIGRHALLAAYVSVGEAGSEVSREPSPRLTAVGDGCWLGVRVQVAAGVEVGHDAIVGAHSRVENSLPPFAVAYGKPARPRGNRDPST